MNFAVCEKRTSNRVRQTGAITWRNAHAAPHADTNIGLILESSDCGMAFAWRGQSVPHVGSVIDVFDGEHDHAGQSSAPSRRAVVRRTEHCHDDLNVIAVEVMRPFPPATEARAHAAIVDLKPLNRAPSLLPTWNFNPIVRRALAG